MNNPRSRESRDLRTWRWLAPVAVLLMAVSFYANSFSVVPETWFRTYQKDSESLIMGRLVESRANGLFSEAGLVGRHQPPSLSERIFLFQYFTYLNEIPGERYTVYTSQSGLHGLLYGIIDLSISPLAPEHRMNILRGLTALLSASALTFIAYWILIEIGWGAAVLAWLSMFGSQWLTATGANLWWAMFFFFLPIIAVILHLWKRETLRSRQLGVVVFATMLIKCMTGFEYITAVSIMTATPVVYWNLKEHTRWRKLVQEVLIVALASFAAVAVSLGLLILQVGWHSRRLAEGVRAVTYALGKRSYGDPEKFTGLLRESHESSLPQVIVTYLKGFYFDSSPLSISYLNLIAVFAVATLLLLILKRITPDSFDSRSTAFIVATWFSITAPLSWFLIFKSHSYIHTHVNFLAWQFPFTIFGFALTGLAIQSTVRVVRERLLRSFSVSPPDG